MRALMTMSRHDDKQVVVETQTDTPQVVLGELYMTPGEALALAGLLTAAVEEIRMYAQMRDLVASTPYTGPPLPDIPRNALDRP